MYVCVYVCVRERETIRRNGEERTLGRQTAALLYDTYVCVCVHACVRPQPCHKTRVGVYVCAWVCACACVLVRV